MLNLWSQFNCELDTTAYCPVLVEGLTEGQDSRGTAKILCYLQEQHDVHMRHILAIRSQWACERMTDFFKTRNTETNMVEYLHEAKACKPIPPHPDAGKCLECICCSL